MNAPREARFPPELLAQLERDLPELARQAYEAVRERVPIYRDEAVPGPELRRSIEQNLRFLVHALPTAGVLPDMTPPEETGRRRAEQHVPLPEVLQAYRITFTVFWDALVRLTHRSGDAHDAEQVLAAATSLWLLSDQHALAVTEAYRTVQAEQLVATEQRRGALVESLLTGHRGAAGGPWEAATLLGLPPDGEFVVVAAEVRGMAEENLTGVGGRLSQLGCASGWRLTPALQLGVVGLGRVELDRVVELLDQLARGRVGVSPAYRSLVDTPRALNLARAAIAILPAGRRRVQVFDSNPLAALVVSDPVEAQRLERHVLGGVLALPVADRTMLLETLHEYLDHGGSAERAGQVLYCHPNTVRYRLRRLQELTGRSLSDPYGLAELVAASYAVRLGIDPADHGRGRSVHEERHDERGAP